jgi:hypothetical protein
MKILYAITHINDDGMRTLTFANQGRNHYQARKDAEAALAAYLSNGSLRDRVLGDKADTLEVRAVECYDHGDAMGIYFSDAIHES